MKSDDQAPAPKSEARRSTLKTLLAGGGVLGLGALPKEWSKPVVDAVFLPAHAQTSVLGASGFTGSFIVERGPGLLDFLIPNAYAGGIPPGPFRVCITEETSTGRWVASLQIGGEVFRIKGDYGGCVQFSCGGANSCYFLRVTKRNSDGSFDYVFFFDGCGDTLIQQGTTDKPCNVLLCDVFEEDDDIVT